MNKKVVLLNPPGSIHYLRDYYCSKTTKASYIYHPIDLLILSGWLFDDFDLSVLDCIVENIGPDETEKRIEGLQPEAIIFLTGAVSKGEDFVFLEGLKKKTGCLMVGTGDCLLGDHDLIRRKAPWLDAIVLDFTTDDLLMYLKNRLLDEENTFHNIVDLSSRSADFPEKRKKAGTADFPIPRYELFPCKRYTYPFVKSLPFATVLIGYGCPFKCRFCVMPGIGYKHRSMKNIVDELDYIRSLKYKDIYFADQTFGCHKRFFKDLCNKMIEKKYNFKWVAFTRVDLISEDFLLLMKKSGCHMLMFGVESPVQRVLDLNNKGISLKQVERAFSLCAKHGIKTLASFIIGLPGTTYDENMLILDFAKKLDPDYASFNVVVPRMGTDLLYEAKRHNWIVIDDGIMDQSGNFSVMGTDRLSAQEIIELKNHIEKKFYFRPEYIVKRIFGVRTLNEARLLASNGLSLLKKVCSIKSSIKF